MGKQKKPKPEAEVPQQEAKSDYVHVIHRFDKALNFPAGWDQGKLSDERIAEIREYLRNNKGADTIYTTVYSKNSRIEVKRHHRKTALFFVQTVAAGELVAGEGNPIPALKGQLVILPAGEDFKIKATTHPREIIEFTF